MLKKFFLCVVLSILIIFVSAAENIILLDDNYTALSLSGKIEIVSIRKNTSTINDLLLSEAELPFRLFFDYTKLPENPVGYWLRFTLRNDSPSQSHYILEYNFYRAGTQIEVYIAGASGEFLVQRQAPGSKHPANALKYRNPVFSFDINYKESKTIYIKLQTEIPVYAHFNIYNSNYFFSSKNRMQMLMGFYYGILFVMAFYNLFLFFAFRDKSFLFLTGFIFNLLILQLYTHGILGEHFIVLQNYDYLMGRIFMLSTTIFFILFGRSFIGSKKHLPAEDKILILLLSVHTFFGILDFFNSGLFIFRIISLILPVLWLILLAVRLWSKANERAKYFILITCSIILFGILTLIQAYIPFLQKFYLLFSDPINVGTILLILLFSFYLTSSISGLQKKDILAQKVLELDEAKSRFFANISHEFRTPLTLITGPLEDMQAESKDKHQQKKIKMMLSNSRRLLNLINQLLDLSMIDNHKLKLQASPGNVISFLKSVIENFSYITAQNQQQLLLNTPLNELELYYDREKMEKIMYNLIINSIKFTPPGGRISITIKKISASGKPMNKAFPSGYAEITVADTGIGISPEHQSRIFDRFYHVNELGNMSHAGTGIGLALVKELVALHHATISVESNRGSGDDAGTRFILCFPLGCKHLTVNEISSDPGSSVLPLSYDIEELLVENEENPTTVYQFRETEKKLILIVDDNADVRGYIRGGLGERYAITEAKDGAEGFKVAKQVIPDLIICDVMMPVMDGFEFCQLIKEELSTSHIPVILLTARAGVENVTEGYHLGADDYMTKPFNMELLHVRINNLIELRRRLQQKIQRKLLLQPAELVGSTRDEEFMQKIQSAIEKNIADSDFNIDALAESLFLSRASLNRKIRALAGESSNQFIQSCRLQRAAEMLESGNLNVTEVAYAVGFSSAAYFTKCFKERFHRVPSHYFQISANKP